MQRTWNARGNIDTQDCALTILRDCPAIQIFPD